MAKYNYDVAWDAGHGSNTSGKRTPDGYREHWINVRVAYYGVKYLTERGLRVLKVAWDDTNAKDDSDISLTARQRKIKNAKCRVAISSHANAHGSGSKYTSAKGVETLIHVTRARRGDSKALADAIQKELMKGTKQSNRGVKYQELAMCNCVAMGVQAAALIEIGFMTNKAEADLMKTDAFCKEQGEDAARGILKYLGIPDKVVSKKEEPKKDTTTFKPYVVKSTLGSLNVRAGAGVKNKVVGVITDNEKLVKKNPDYYFPNVGYTIVEEKMNGKTKWGRMKSGKNRWISLQYTKKVK